MQEVVENEKFRIAYSRGTSGITIVSFAGVGLIESEPPRLEMMRCFAPKVGRPHHSVIFVVDKQRRWYVDGFYEELISIINQVLVLCETKHTVTLGNSMGGFAAIIFASRLDGCSLSISFAPQTSIHPDVVPFETRWPRYQRRIVAWDIKDALTVLDDTVSYCILYGDRVPLDDKHAERFRAVKRSNMDLRIIKNCGHNVAGFLKQRNSLRGTIEKIISANISVES